MKKYDLTTLRTKWYKELPVDPKGENIFFPRDWYKADVSGEAKTIIMPFIAKDQDPSFFYDEESLIALSRNDNPSDEGYLTPFRVQKYVNELVKYGILIEVED